MIDFQFNELVDIVKEVYHDFLESAYSIGEGHNQAISRFFVDYGVIMNSGITESFIVVSTLCISLRENRITEISSSHYAKLDDVLKKYKETIPLTDLNVDENKALSKMIAEAKTILGTMETT